METLTCIEEDCQRPLYHKGSGHCRWHRGQTLMAQRPPCSFEGGCDNPMFNVTYELCEPHNLQRRRYGVLKPITRNKPGEGNITKAGYRRHTKNYVEKLEHRLVMEKKLGRDLLRTEEVHHKNGQKLDNDPSNLEMWDESQPAGQRVVDKLEWMLNFIPTYWSEDEMAEALTRHAYTCDVVGCICCERLLDDDLRAVGS